MRGTLVAVAFLSLICLIGGNLWRPGPPRYDLLRSSVVALVLARGGSKGLPLKNLRRLDGISLLGRSLQTIQDSDVFAEVWVSTDHDGIAAEAKRFGANVHFRPSNVSHDNSTSIESVQEFIQHYPHIPSVALIQCTSVFLQPIYLLSAVRAFHGADCVFSVVPSYKLRWKWQQENWRLVPLNFDPSRRPRRQDWDGEMIEAGMFYVASRELLEDGRFQNDRCRPVVIAMEDSLEIDTLADLQLAALLLEQRRNRSN